MLLIQWTWFVYWCIVNSKICKHTNSIDKRWISASWIWNLTEPKFLLIHWRSNKRLNDFFTRWTLGRRLKICIHCPALNWTTAGRSRRHTSVRSSQLFSSSVNLSRNVPIGVQEGKWDKPLSRIPHMSCFTPSDGIQRSKLKASLNLRVT